VLFPTPLGWGFCASGASGGDYPNTNYDYLPAGAPAGANGASFAPVGFALSQADAEGFWSGQPGLFNADEAAVAAKLFYDYFVWGGPVPSMDPGVAAAYNQLLSWEIAAQGATGTPLLSLNLANPSSVAPLASTATAVVSFPGSSNPVPGVPITLNLTNGSFPGGATSITLFSDAQGSVSVSVTASGAGTLSVSGDTVVGQLGLLFFAPSRFDLAAQEIVAGLATTQASASASIQIDTELYVEKWNATEPGQGIPGADYNLFVQGTPPTPTPTPLVGTVVPAGMTWWASGTTDQGGHLGFDIPAGYAWCVQELSVPPEFIFDPALHCTAVITVASSDPVRTVAVAEVVSSVTLTALKFNVAKPGQVIPGASYALFVVGAFPTGFTPPTPPPSVNVPAGMELFATGTTDPKGSLVFTMPSGHRWCLQELIVPAGYILDPGLHCTGLLNQTSSGSETTLALPELADPPKLPETGAGSPWPGGLGLLLCGLLLLRWSARRRRLRDLGTHVEVQGGMI
jgi:LPXTG-motif cell wall-anchored protein